MYQYLINIFPISQSLVNLTLYPKLLIQTLAKLHQISSQCVIDSFASNAIAAAESGNSFH